MRLPCTPRNLPVDGRANHRGFTDTSGARHTLEMRLLPILQIDLLSDH